ncbi:hypothetical protein ABI_33120 [Asticcacaulis biprosthecium C19]|uniref:Uncharacterized protein n=1 Tax=Asticcacaulis biprosthecium C19 TaxID=715226 RepID=F4QQ08_9CAUL|nr:hypothetical protein [Asticcacaulis biprosthecium]EGF90295.1 hypothetical protein ABI_33120 [Asticcacaulis biprosthecium C19]
MSKPDKSALARIVLIAATGAVVLGGGVAFLSASAQEKAIEDTPDQPLAYQAYKADTVQGADAAVAAPTTAQPLNRAIFAQSSSSQASSSQATIARAPFRGDIVAGKSVLLRKPMAPAKVDWSAAMKQNERMETQQKTARTARPSLKARLSRPDLDKTRLPVILPREGGVVDTAKAKMVSFGDAYAINMPQPDRNGVQVTVYGNRTFVASDSGTVSKRPFARLAGVAEDVRIGQMEDGWTATFTRYGVVYSIDVSCDSINTPDCKTDDYIRNVIAQMDDVTMGSEAQKEAGVQIKEDSNWLNQVSKTISNITKGN